MANKEKTTMTFETVISPVKDEKINSHIRNSEIWKKAYKAEEITERVRGGNPNWYEYTIQFDGLKPIMMTKMREI
jgi:hypothetical protein